MKVFAVISVVLIVLFAILTSGMTDYYVSAKVRYKMTVSVETPEGVKKGYAVRQISVSDSKILSVIKLPEMTNAAKVRGEAVVVDLGDRGKLFALLRGGRFNYENDQAIVFYNLGGGTGVKGIRELKRLEKHKPVTLDYTDYPYLVTFKDINDPNSVALAMEMKDISGSARIQLVPKKDHFEELFGQGVKLRSITIEMTDEPVTWNIEQHIPWLHTHKSAFPPSDPQNYNNKIIYFIPKNFQKRD